MSEIVEKIGEKSIIDKQWTNTVSKMIEPKVDNNTQHFDQTKLCGQEAIKSSKAWQC